MNMAQFHASRTENVTNGFIGFRGAITQRALDRSLIKINGNRAFYLHQIGHLLERGTFADQRAERQSIAPRRCHVVDSHIVTFNHPTTP